MKSKGHASKGHASKGHAQSNALVSITANRKLRD